MYVKIKRIVKEKFPNISNYLYIGKQKIKYYCKLYSTFKIDMILLLKRGYVANAVGRYNLYEKQKVAYVDVTKVASTSIKKVFSDLNHLQKFSHQESNKTFGKATPPPADYFSFTFVRNPFERLVSTYTNKYTKSIYKGNVYYGYLFGFIKLEQDFAYFVKKVSQIPDRLSEVHFVSQTAIVFDKKGKPRVKFIGKYENLTADWAKIQQQVAFHLPDLPHMNQSKKGDWRTFYTPELVEMVYKRYKNDVHNFGYEQEYHDLLAFVSK